MEEMYSKELAHVIMEADKSQYLQGELSTWRPRRAGGVVPESGPVFQFKSEGMEKGYPRCKTGEVPSSLREGQPFCSS